MQAYSAATACTIHDGAYGLRLSRVTVYTLITAIARHASASDQPRMSAMMAATTEDILASPNDTRLGLRVGKWLGVVLEIIPVMDSRLNQVVELVQV